MANYDDKILKGQQLAYFAEKIKDSLDNKQEKLPTITNDKFLHTNSSTGALEWSDGGGGDNASFGTNDILEFIDGTNTPIEANPSGSGTDDLEKIRIGDTIYDIVGGSSINVVQTTGTSTEDVMSQKAVTDALPYSQKNNVKYSPETLFSSVAGDNPYGTAYSVETFTQDTLFVATIIEKLLYQNGNPYNQKANTFLCLYKDDNNYIKIEINSYTLRAEIKMNGTVQISETHISDATFNKLYNSKAYASRVDLSQKKLEFWDYSNESVLTKIYDVDFSNVDISYLDTFRIKTTIGGRHGGMQACKSVRINSYFNIQQYLDFTFNVASYNSLPRYVGKEFGGMKPTQVFLGGTITSTISPLHKISNVNQPSQTYFKLMSYNPDFATKYNACGMVKAKFTNMSADFVIEKSAVSEQTAILDSNMNLVYFKSNKEDEQSVGGTSFTPTDGEWYYIWIQGRNNTWNYYNTYTIYLKGSATIEADATDGWMGYQHGMTLCAENYNGSFFTGNFPFECDYLPPYIPTNWLSSSSGLTPKGAMYISDDNIYMHNGTVWKQISN